MRFGLSFTRKARSYHRTIRKTLAKVEVSDNAGYVLSYQRSPFPVRTGVRQGCIVTSAFQHLPLMRHLASPQGV